MDSSRSLTNWQKPHRRGFWQIVKERVSPNEVGTGACPYGSRQL